MVYTATAEETKRKLASLGDSIYNDPNPEIVQQAVCESARRYEQRILVRYLQPPPAPEPGVMKQMSTNAILLVFV